MFNFWLFVLLLAGAEECLASRALRANIPYTKTNPTQHTVSVFPRCEDHFGLMGIIRALWADGCLMNKHALPLFLLVRTKCFFPFHSTERAHYVCSLLPFSKHKNDSHFSHIKLPSARARAPVPLLLNQACNFASLFRSAKMTQYNP